LLAGRRNNDVDDDDDDDSGCNADLVAAFWLEITVKVYTCSQKKFRVLLFGDIYRRWGVEHCTLITIQCT